MNITPALAEAFSRNRVAAPSAPVLTFMLVTTGDFEMRSPFIGQFTGEVSGTLKGKPKLAACWETALSRRPDLWRKLLHVLAGTTSVTLAYCASFGRRALWRRTNRPPC